MGIVGITVLRSDILRGHHDIKPENVMVVSNGAQSSSEYQFKFADFGLNSVRDKGAHDGEATSHEMQDAAPYGRSFVE